MNPAPPVTKIFKFASTPSASLGKVTGQSIVPVGQLDRVSALAAQHREGRSGSRATEHLGGGRKHPAFDSGLVEDLTGELEPGAGPGSRHVVDAVGGALDQAHQA